MSHISNSVWNERYAIAQSLQLAADLVANGTVYPHWIDDECFWYERRGRDGAEYRVVAASTGQARAVLTKCAVARSLSVHLDAEVDSQTLLLRDLKFARDISSASFNAFGEAYLYRLADKALIPSVSQGNPNWVISPDGRLAAFLRDFNLWIREIQTGREWPLTQDGSEHYAYADTPAAKRTERAWLGSAPPEGRWSPDSRRFFTLQVDDRHVPELPMIDFVQFDTSRVLINLHGGGFRVGSGALQLIESLPIAATARIRVISIDYSLSPEHKFPAASEDVAAVYRELIKHFLPAQIGIYGCSSGGMLTAMSVAWFQREKLPRPGAIGIFCSGLDYSGGGDSAYIAGPLQPYLSGVKVLPPPPNPNPPAQSNEYLGSADPRDPMVSPGYYPDRISQFPPTLIVTGTRDDAMSSAVHAHAELDRAGVQTELHVWEGMWHGFFFNVDLPESQEMYKVTSRFFNAHLETSH